MLIGRTKHIFYIKIQASSDNYRISFFKTKEEEERKQIFLLCFMVNSCFCLYVYTIKVRVYCHKIVIKLIVHYNYQCQLLSVGFFNPFDVKR